MKKAWSFLTLGDDRQYGGNSGYEDDLTVVYKYDSKVPNHKKVQVGDFVVLRAKKAVLGTAVVNRIEETLGPKQFNRCPECNTTSIRHRPSKSPAWRCDVHRHEFDEPLVSESEVRLFEAFFEGSFVPLEKELAVDHLREIAINRNDQHAIQRLDLGRLEDLLTSDEIAKNRLLDVISSSVLRPDDAEEDETEFAPSMTDNRESTLRAIKSRRGQRKFRNRILKRYGSTCVVSGCQVEQLLEAAHILPYRGEEYNHPSNGLLLRSDLHTLFDLGILRIQPGSLLVYIDNSIVDPTYRQFHGRRLNVSERSSPSQKAISVLWRGWSKS